MQGRVPVECDGGLLHLFASKRQNVRSKARWRVCRASSHISTTDLSCLNGPPIEQAVQGGVPVTPTDATRA